VLDWIAVRVRRARGIGDDEPVAFEFPRRGRRTPVARVHCAGETVIAKLVAGLPQVAVNAAHLRYLASRELPVPRLLDWSRAAPARAWLTLEECIDGRTLDDLPAAERASGLARIARTLSALHAQRRRTRGWIGMPRPGGYAPAYLSHALERAERLRDLLPADELDRVAAGLRRTAGAIGARARHELIHGHVNPGNFLVAAEAAFLIDVNALHYGDATRDLVRALGRLCKSPQEMSDFLARYFEHEDASQSDFERAEPFYACDFLLRLTRKRADRALREGVRDPGAIRDEAHARLELCLALLRPDGPRFHQTPVPFSSPQA
jgi:Ser/Thr protein kinase RdoA (MazF antagonist)